MVRFVKQFPSGEKGQALAIVLCLLALGSLTIAASLNYATTNLKGSRIVEEKTAGIYAAGAGVEYALWALQKGLWSLPEGVPTANATPENINQMAVSTLTENEGDFTMYLGELLDTSGVHADWIDVIGSITDMGGGVYKYTVTITWRGEEGGPQAQTIKLQAVGARLPPDYSYNAASAANFTENLSLDEPDETQDIYDAWMVNWVFSPPYPEVTEDDPVQTQTFYITGTGTTSGHYASAEGLPDTVGQVGEITGTRYSITSTATRPEDGRTTASIVADIIIRDDGTTTITSWQISN